MKGRPPAPPPAFALSDLPVLSAAEMRAWDERAIEQRGVPQRVLMENAGRAVAEVVQALHPHGAVLVLCGSGNNGGDGLVAARVLRTAGREVRVLAAGSRPPDPALAHGVELERVDADAAPTALGDAAVVVDALLGTGFSGAPRPPLDRLIGQVNEAGVPVLAVDGPSGLDFTTGQAAGAVIHATTTVTFGAPKRGLLLFPGRALAGRIVCAEIGFPPLEQQPGARLITHRWAAGRLPPVPPDAHKGRMGRVVIVAGRARMAGAAVLAANGALRAGAGMAVVVSPEANRVILQSAVPEALYEDAAEVADDVFAAADVVVAGPALGTGDAALALLRQIFRSAGCPLLLDADATTLLARHPGLRDEARQPLLLTPHPGEAARLLGGEVAAVTADPFAAARELAAKYRCSVLLKGSPSLVAAAEHPTLVSVGGHSGLATGGMGDTLSGAAGAVLARCRDAWTAAGVALWYCGRAAELAGRGRGLLPRDVAEALPAALLEEPLTSSPLGLSTLTLDLAAAR